MRILPHARIPELPNPYFGKVRDCYDLANNTRILISSDRISAFDRILAAIPYKGQVLTQTARYWFDATADLCPNHVLSYPDPNVVIGQRLTILPLEIVVRGYLAGSTSTSILTQYKQGVRSMYGYSLPDGMRDNQPLPHAIITPTSKAFDGGHDEPLTPDQIISQGLLTDAQWQDVSAKALALFARGQKMAAGKGLILSIPNTNSGWTPPATSFSPTRYIPPTAAATGSPQATAPPSTPAPARPALTRMSSAPGSSLAATPITTRSPRSPPR